MAAKIEGQVKTATGSGITLGLVSWALPQVMPFWACSAFFNIVNGIGTPLSLTFHTIYRLTHWIIKKNQ